MIGAPGCLSCSMSSQAVKSQLSEAEVALQAAHTDRQATEAIIEQLQKDKQALASDKKVRSSSPYR